MRKTWCPLSSEKVQALLAICILANKSCSWDNLFLYLIILLGFRELYLLSCPCIFHFACVYKRTYISNFPFSSGISRSFLPVPSEQASWEDLILTPFLYRVCHSWSYSKCQITWGKKDSIIFLCFSTSFIWDAKCSLLYSREWVHNPPNHINRYIQSCKWNT